MNLIQLSSLEKVFLQGKFDKKEFNGTTALKGEKISYQIAFKYEDDNSHYKSLKINVNSDLKDYIKLYTVGSVPSHLPVHNSFFYGNDENYISKDAGLYPDILYPCDKNTEIYSEVWSSLWVEISIPNDIKAGKYNIEIEFSFDDYCEKKVFKLEVLNAQLPEQTLKYTQWFYCDSLYTYYSIEPFCEKHWEIIENFAKLARENGMNMILTPVITPTLDVDIGKDRPTNQLVKIEKNKDEYIFDFSLLDRWIEMCDRVGIEYFEICHMFTQWGAKSASKVMAYENGEYKKIFGWETPATSDEYVHFLNQFIPALTSYFEKNNLKERVYFHISDEPNLSNMESYKAAREVLASLVKDYKSIDALSNYEFYEKGLVNIPVVANNHIKPFLGKGISELWTYYCCAQAKDVSNRFMSMPSARNRILGIQMYKYGIKGFLHWGYNFYFAARTRKKINPFITTDALNTFPSGDAFSVYPGEDGIPYPSLRMLVFNEGLQDLRALKALEEKIGYDNVVELIVENLNYKIEFDKYPSEAEYILNLREKINRILDKS
ncbi:MAG: DUF4091 domain-containing protein [Ruminococcaceae bacterium]|nr:DUF4091 domain-containing protein [Oscillospiraceae bacterium]